MKTNALALGAMLLLSGALVPAQAPPAPQPPAGAPGAQGRGQRPAPDPRSMGGGDCRANPYNCVDTPNPLPAPDTVWLEEMTWMDVRDALKAGKTTVIIPTGGIEPNGPWLALGKHNYVLRDQLRRHRAQARERAVRADHRAGAGRRDRAAARPHAQPRHHQHARGDVPGDPHRRRAQPEDARLPEHHLHRRQRREPGRPEGRRREAQRAVERQPRRRAHRASTTRRRPARPTCCASSASSKTASRTTACTTARASRST